MSLPIPFFCEPWHFVVDIVFCFNLKYHQQIFENLTKSITLIPLVSYLGRFHGGNCYLSVLRTCCLSLLPCLMSTFLSYFTVKAQIVNYIKLEHVLLTHCSPLSSCSYLGTFKSDEVTNSHYMASIPPSLSFKLPLFSLQELLTAP